MIKSNRERVYQAIVDYVNANQRPVGRKRLAQITGLSLQQLDEHIKTLKEDNPPRIHSETAGYYEPVAMFPPARHISVTVLTDGMHKLEYGDEIAEFTPHEWAVIGRLASGSAKDLVDRTDDRTHHAAVNTLRAQIKDQSRQITDMAAVMARLQRKGQPDLFEGKKKETQT